MSWCSTCLVLVTANVCPNDSCHIINPTDVLFAKCYATLPKLAELLQQATDYLDANSTNTTATIIARKDIMLRKLAYERQALSEHIIVPTVHSQLNLQEIQAYIPRSACFSEFGKCEICNMHDATMIVRTFYKLSELHKYDYLNICGLHAYTNTLSQTTCGLYDGMWVVNNSDIWWWPVNYQNKPMNIRVCVVSNNFNPNSDDNALAWVNTQQLSEPEYNRINTLNNHWWSDQSDYVTRGFREAFTHKWFLTLVKADRQIFQNIVETMVPIMSVPMMYLE